MSHLTEDRLRAWIDGELEGFARESVEDHLDGCAACRLRQEQVRVDLRHVTSALARLDLRPPPPTPSVVLQRHEAIREARRTVAALLAVGLLSATAVMAVPGSPMRQWLESSAGPAPPSELQVRGLGIPAQPEMIVELPGSGSGSLVVRVRPSDELELRVFGHWAEFAVAGNRLRLDGQPRTATYELDVSPLVRSLRVLRGTDPVFVLSGGELGMDAEGDASSGWTVEWPSR